MAVRVTMKSSSGALDGDEVQPGVAAVDGVEVAADDQRPAAPTGQRRGLSVADDTVALDRLVDLAGVRRGVGGEVPEPPRGDLRGVHPGDALAAGELAPGTIEVPQPALHAASTDAGPEPW